MSLCLCKCVFVRCFFTLLKNYRPNVIETTIVLWWNEDRQQTTIAKSQNTKSPSHSSIVVILITVQNIGTCRFYLLFSLNIGSLILDLILLFNFFDDHFHSYSNIVIILMRWFVVGVASMSFFKEKWRKIRLKFVIT